MTNLEPTGGTGPIGAPEDAAASVAGERGPIVTTIGQYPSGA
jgi:hypothetical protein